MNPLAIYQVLQSMSCEQLLQFAQQLKLPIAPASLFAMNHKQKTAKPLEHRALKNLVAECAIQNQSNIRTLRWAPLYSSIMAVSAMSALFTTAMYHKQHYKYFDVSTTVLRIKAKLLKSSFWDNPPPFKATSGTGDMYEKTKGYIRMVLDNFCERAANYKKKTTLVSELRNGNPFASTLSFHDMKDVGLNPGEGGDLASLGFSEYAQHAYYKENEFLLHPTLFSMKLMMMLFAMNTLFKTVLPQRDYVKYARKLAQPQEDDDDDTYGDSYDGCLRGIDDRYHRFFNRIDRDERNLLSTANDHLPRSKRTDVNEMTMNHFWYQLFQNPGSRRQLELWHVVRGDGALRESPNEVAHSIAKADTWGKYFGDGLQRMRNLVRTRKPSRTGSHYNQHTAKRKAIMQKGGSGPSSCSTSRRGGRTFLQRQHQSQHQSHKRGQSSSTKE